MLVRRLNTSMKQNMSAALETSELTAAQGHIMGFVAQRQEPPCSRDIEAAFGLSHPTVSGILARLVKKEFLELRPDPRDHRYNRIYVLPKGQQLNQIMHQRMLDTERQVVAGFTDLEQAQFRDFLERAIANMETKENQSFKEEPKE